MELFSVDKRKNIILAVVFLLTVFLITFHFTDTPNVWVDEGVFTETAKNLATQGRLALQTAPNEFFSMRSFLLSTSYPVIFPVALSIKLFGTGIVQARVTMLIYMFLLVLVFYLFTKKRYGFYPAILSVLLLLSFSPFYGNGRPVQGEVPGLFFLVLGSYFLLLLEESDFQNKKWAVFSGLAFGLSASVKPIFLLGVTLSLFFSLLLWFRKNPTPGIGVIKNRGSLAFFGLGFIPPILLWMYITVPTFTELLKFVPNLLYFSGSHNSSTSVAQTIITNLLRFLTESTPILFSFLSIFIFASFIYKTGHLAILVAKLSRYWRWWHQGCYFGRGGGLRRHYFTPPILVASHEVFSASNKFKKEKSVFSISECVIFSFILLNLVGYLKGTGWYRYFFPAHTLLYLFFPISILYSREYFENKVIKKILSIIPIALIIFQTYHLIFLSDTSFVVNRRRTFELSKALGEINSSQKVIFYNTIEAEIFLKSNNYSQYLTLGGFLEAGNKDILSNPDVDFILTNGSENDNLTLSCYGKKPISQYILYERNPKCLNSYDKTH